MKSRYNISKENSRQTKEDGEVGADVKPIQATPTLSSKDTMQIIKQVVAAPSPESIEKNKRMLEMRRRIVGNISTEEALKDIILIQWSEDVLAGNKKVIVTKSL